jgi:hypothetical protein
MLLRQTRRFRPDCDGCGAPAPSAMPAGWFARPLDPPYYKGPRQILFCPTCFAELPLRQRRRWHHLQPETAEPWLQVLTRRLLHRPPRRRAIG